VPLLDGPDVSLSYTVSGEGEPVTLLHGFTLSGRNWRELVAKTPSRWMWIVPDLRGHGETRTARGAPCTMDACTSDLQMLWNHLGIGRSHLVGYSMGGRLALHVAVRLPERVRSLLTISAHAGLEEQARAGRVQGDEALAERIERFGVEPFVNYWQAQPLFAGLERRGEAYAAQVRLQRLANRPEGLAASLRGMGAGAMEPLWDELGGIVVPCTFVAGEDDAAYVASARRLAEAVPGARLEIVARAGHSVHMQRPAPVARILAAHLRRAGDPAAAGSATSSLTPA
jgi:2-succinyl-6-hydroxy-2,4-cyclohexadiene-1-carboxylate synthase